MNPFEYLNAINNTKKDIMIDDLSEKQYNSFMINRGLSYFQDTVLMANEMNVNHHIDNRLQFRFFINIIRPRKRFSKWFKPETENDVEVSVIMHQGIVSMAGDSGFHYVLLLDGTTFDTMYQDEVSPNNGSYAYNFPSVAEGNYIVFAGTDSDNDYTIGDSGEAPVPSCLWISRSS